MAPKRPNLKRPGVSMTGRQWNTVEALQRDGWLVLSVDPSRWSDEQIARVRAGLAAVDSIEASEPT